MAEENCNFLSQNPDITQETADFLEETYEGGKT